MELEPKENSENKFEKNLKSKREVAEHFANITNHALIAITTFYITWYSFTVGFHEYQTVHAWFTTVGYQLFMSEGILVLYNKNIYTIPVRNRWMKKRIHWILQAIGGGMALFGIPYQIYNRQITNRKHFSNTHGITGKFYFLNDDVGGFELFFSLKGLISGIFLILTIISGCSALFSIELKRYIRPFFSKASHNFLSVTCYTLGMVSIISAYVTRSWLVKKDPGEVRFIMIWCLSFVLAFTLVGPLKTGFSQLKEAINLVKTRSRSQ